MSRRAQLLLLVMAAAACTSAPPLILTGVHGAPRVVATLGVLLLAPGAVIAGAALEPGLVVGASLGSCTVVAQAMLASGVWAPEPMTCALALGALPFVARRIYTLLQAGQAGRQNRDGDPGRATTRRKGPDRRQSGVAP